MPKREPLVLVGYVAVSVGYFGWRLLPHPGRTLLGTGQDPLIFVWSFAWWPHALLAWTNPFVTHALYAPEGINLVWTTSVPGLALAFAPLTLLFGPVVSFNVAALLLPALAAWTAYRLCFHLTRSGWASLVGGYLFGFSSFIVGQQQQGHLNLTGVFLLPLIALVLVRFVQNDLSARASTVRLGILLGLQLSISTELALTATVALVVGLTLAYCLVRDSRARVRAALLPVAKAYALGAVLTAPLLVYGLLGFQRQGFSGAEASGTDLLNTLVPTHVNAVGGTSLPSVTANFNDTESAAYLGLPTLLILALFAWRARGSPWARFLVAGLVLSILIALGTVLRADGHRVVTLPWMLARHVPGLDNVHFPRFAVYAALAAAVVVALWIARTKGRIYPRPYLLPLLAVGALVPAFWHPIYSSHPDRPRFFAGALDKDCLHRGDNLAVFPFGHAGDSMLWQAESGFRFRLAEGGMTPLVIGAGPVSAFDRDPIVQELIFRTYSAFPRMDALLAFAGRHRVARFISVVGDGYPSAKQMRRFGPVEQLGGVLVAPACGRPALTSRDLSAFVAKDAAESGHTIGYCLGPTNYFQLDADLYPAGVFRGAKPADFIYGQGLGCAPPAGYTRHGFATEEMGVPANLYPYFAP